MAEIFNGTVHFDPSMAAQQRVEQPTQAQASSQAPGQNQETVARFRPKITNIAQDFPSIMETFITTTFDFQKYMRDVFEMVFPQFHFPSISIQPINQTVNGVNFVTNGIYAAISFDDDVMNPNYGPGRYKAIEPIVDNTRLNDTLAKINAINNNSKQKNNNGPRFKFTKEAEDILLDFVPDSCIKGKISGGVDNRKIDWKAAAEEQTIVHQNVKYHSVIVSIDLIKFIKVLFEVDPLHPKADYAVSLGQPIMNNNGNNLYGPATYSYLLYIVRGDNKNIEKLCASYGFADKMVAAARR